MRAKTGFSGKKYADSEVGQARIRVGRPTVGQGVEMKETPTMLMKTKGRKIQRPETPTIFLKIKLLTARYSTILMKIKIVSGAETPRFLPSYCENDL